MIIVNTSYGYGTSRLLSIIALSFLCISLICSVAINILEKKKSSAMFYSIAALVLLASCLVIVLHKRPVRYEILVTDDSIPYSEFCEHWNVVDHKGGIIVAERIDDFPTCEYCGEMYENDFTIFCPNCGASIREVEE